jgi:hypothetical protein
MLQHKDVMLLDSYIDDEYYTVFPTRYYSQPCRQLPVGDKMIHHTIVVRFVYLRRNQRYTTHTPPFEVFCQGVDYILSHHWK